MQLFLNATSPFARLARVAALEKGLADQLTLVWSDPWGQDSQLQSAHPQHRIPVLCTADGNAIAESMLIAQYLDHIGNGAPLVPPGQAAPVLARTSVAYGLMEAAFNLVIARKYEGAATADTSVMGQRRSAAIQRVLAQLEALPPVAMSHDPQRAVTLDQITTAIALAYVQFRLPTMFTAIQYPQLHAWLQHSEQRPSLAETAFVS